MKTLPLFLLISCAWLPLAFSQESEGIKPAEVVKSSLKAILPAKAPGDVPFTVYQITPHDRHSSLVVELTGAEGDADLLLVADKPMQTPEDALFYSAGPTSAERLELRRNTVPALRNTDYFLYVFHSQTGGENLNLSIRLNLLADDGLKKMPQLPKGVISHEALKANKKDEGKQATPWFMSIQQSAMVNLAIPAGAPPGPTQVRIQVPEGKKTLEIDLWGNLSDLDLSLLGPELNGEKRIKLLSEQEGSREQILVRAKQNQASLPAGDWILTIHKRDQLPTQPLLLNVNMR